MYFVLDFSVQGSKNRINWLNQFDLTTLTPKELSLCGDYILYGDEQLEKARKHLDRREERKDRAIQSIKNSTLFADTATGKLSNESQTHTKKLLDDIDKDTEKRIVKGKRINKKDPYISNEEFPIEIIINTKYDDFKKNRVQCSLDYLISETSFNETVSAKNTTQYKVIKTKLDKEKLDKIPGIQGIYDAIEKLKQQYNEETDRQKKYYLKHQLIDVRMQQYVLYDAYYPTVKLYSTTFPHNAYVPQCYREMEYPILPRGVAKNIYDEDFLYPRKSKREVQIYKVPQKGHYIDYTNPDHIKMLIKYRDDIIEQSSKDIESPLMGLIDTFDIYVKLAHLTKKEKFILDMRLKDIQNMDVPRLFLQEFGYTHQDNYFSTLYTHICEKIANAARLNYKEALYKDNKSKWKKCCHCGRWFLRDEGFFVKNSYARDGLKSQCRFCDKKARNRREEKKKNG